MIDLLCGSTNWFSSGYQPTRRFALSHLKPSARADGTEDVVPIGTKTQANGHIQLTQR